MPRAKARTITVHSKSFKENLIETPQDGIPPYKPLPDNVPSPASFAAAAHEDPRSGCHQNTHPPTHFHIEFPEITPHFYFA